MGAGESKTRTLAETINTTLNEVVTKSSNTIKNTATSKQRMQVKCTAEQAKIAADLLESRTKSYQEALDSYYKYGAKGEPPKEPQQTLCILSNATQNSNVTLKSDTNSKNKLIQEIEKNLDNKVNSFTQEKLEDPIIGYSSSDVEVINTIKNNIQNKTYTENLTEVVSAALVEQEIIIDGAAANNVSQTAAVSLITEALFDSITENIDKTLLYNSSETKLEIEKKSGQSTAFQALTNLIGSVFTGFFGIVFVFIIGICLIARFAPQVFCFIPGINVAMASSCRKTDLNKTAYQDYTNRPQQPVYQQQPFYPGYPSPGQPGYPNIIPVNSQYYPQQGFTG